MKRQSSTSTALRPWTKEDCPSRQVQQGFMLHVLIPATIPQGELSGLTGHSWNWSLVPLGPQGPSWASVSAQSTIFHYHPQKGPWILSGDEQPVSTTHTWAKLKGLMTTSLHDTPLILEVKSKLCTLWLKIRHPPLPKEEPILSALLLPIFPAFSNVISWKLKETANKKNLNFFCCYFYLQRCMLPPQDSAYVIVTLVWRVWMGICIKPGPGAVLSNYSTWMWWSRELPEMTLLRTKKRSTPKFCALRTKTLVLFLFPGINDPLHSATPLRICCRENAWHLCLVFITSFYQTRS